MLQEFTCVFASLSAALKQTPANSSLPPPHSPTLPSPSFPYLPWLVYITMTIKANDEWHVENND